jgi:hypothetical protein
MAKRKAKRQRLPEDVMSGVLWSFNETRYADRAEFDAAVRKYHIDIREEDTWEPDEIVLVCPRVRITCDCYWEDDEGERVLELTSDNGTSFTAGELLFKVHHGLLEPHKVGNSVVHSELGDHHFFEGLSLEGQPAEGETPRYEIDLGS